MGVITVVGVDPGVCGGIAALDETGAVLWTAGLRPTMTHGELVGLVCEYLRSAEAVSPLGRYLYMERVGYMRGDGGQGAFTFGQVNGLLRGAILACEWEIRDVMPMVWQGALDCLSGGNKNVTKRRAVELFPGVKVTHSIADALLLAEYGRRRIVNPGGIP